MPGYHPVKHLLLATDLGARCDRALALARLWQARLTVTHAIDIKATSSDQPAEARANAIKQRAASEIRRDFADHTDIDINYEIREGKPPQTVLDIAAARNCDMIVTGIARDDPFGSILLGSTTETIVHGAQAPVLVVKKKPHTPYSRVVIASDLSSASVPALGMAVGLFGSAELRLFHAFDMPFRGLADDKGSYESGMARQAHRDALAFLDMHAKQDAGGIAVEVAHGDPATRLAEYAAKHDIDLMITGAHGRSGFLSMLLGSVAQAILEQVGCDVMIVPGGNARPSN